MGRYLHKVFMQRQFHFFEYFINAPLPVSVSEITIGPYFGKPLRQYVLLKAADKFSMGTAGKRPAFFYATIYAAKPRRVNSQK